jgi:glycosyltransferase involved in cell wall biosynthesis
MKRVGKLRRMRLRPTPGGGHGNSGGDIGGLDGVADHQDMADLRTVLGPRRDPGSPPLVIATLHRPHGSTGVQTHVRELLQYLERRGQAATLLTPFSWGGPLRVPVFGPRLVLSRLSRPAGVVWHRHWHEVFLRKALRKHLGTLDDCIIYAQGPLAARAALSARRGPHQRVVMAIHFRVSQADEYVESRQIKQDGWVFHRIRQVEREVIPRLDGAVSVTKWARDALVEWLPPAADVPYAIVSNFVYRQNAEVSSEPLGDLVTMGRLEPVKNHGFLLEALAEAKQRGRRYTMDIYGEGECRTDLERMAAALGLEGQVRFRGFRSDVRTLLPRYRAYVHAAYSESSSLAIMESMAAGLPVLAGQLEPLAELCDDGVEARFFPLADPAQAAAVVIDLLECEPARVQMSRAARARFDRDFDADVIAPQLMSFLEASGPSMSGHKS